MHLLFLLQFTFSPYLLHFTTHVCYVVLTILYFLLNPFRLQILTILPLIQSSIESNMSKKSILSKHLKNSSAYGIRTRDNLINKRVNAPNLIMGGPSIGTFLNFVVWQHQTSYRPEILTVY